MSRISLVAVPVAALSLLGAAPAPAPGPSPATAPRAAAPADATGPKWIELTVNGDLGHDDVDGDGVVSAGDTLSGTAEISVTGTSSFRGITVRSSNGNTFAMTCEDAAANSSATCETTSPYTITQGDLEAGSTVVWGRVSGEVDGVSWTSPSAYSFDVAAFPRGARMAVALSQVTGSRAVGDTVAFRAIATNRGSVPLTDLRIDGGSAFSCESDAAAWGSGTACTAERVLTQSDLDAGQITETVTASAEWTTGAEGERYTSEPASVTVPIETHADAALEASGEHVHEDGENGVARFTARFRNTGDVTLRQPSAEATDTAAAMAACDADTVAPGAAVECVIDVPVSDDDMASGVLQRDVNVVVMTPTGQRIEWAAKGVRVTLDPVDPDPVDPADPVDPVDPIDPVEPVDPIRPVDPIAPPTDPGDSKPEQPGSAVSTGQRPNPTEHLADIPALTSSDQNPKVLPFTGTDVTAGVVAGVSMLAAGLGLLATRLRRRAGNHRG